MQIKNSAGRSRSEEGIRADVKRPKSDLEKLEDLKNSMFDRFREVFEDDTGKGGENRKTFNYIPKVGDLVKIIELQRKLSSDSKAEEKFWALIERLRQEELNHA